MNWVTEITHVKDFEYFVDEQRFGPYKFWHHKHLIKEIKDGVEMIDILDYALPFGFAGRFFHPIIIKLLFIRVYTFVFLLLPLGTMMMLKYLNGLLKFCMKKYILYHH